MNAPLINSNIALLMLAVALVACPTTGGTPSPQPPPPGQPPPGQPQTGNPGYGGTMVYDAGAVIYRHRTNIARLAAGTENRFGRRGAAPRA